MSRKDEMMAVLASKERVEVNSSQCNDGILRERRTRISLFTPEWSASFDHQIVLLKILSVLELSCAAQVETEFSP